MLEIKNLRAEVDCKPPRGADVSAGARMRDRLGLALALLVAGPAGASESGPLANYSVIQQTFLGGDASSEFPIKYRDYILNKIDGTWVPLSALVQAPPQLPSSDELKTFCDKRSVRIARTSSYAFSIIQSPETDHELKRTYTSISGSTFSEYVDPEKLLHWYGIDKVANGEPIKLSTLSGSNGLVTIWRATDEFLVLQRLAGTPVIFWHCP